MAYDFNGSNSYLSALAAPVSAAPMTLAFWFNKDTLGTDYGVWLNNSDNRNTSIGVYFVGGAVNGYIQGGSFAQISTTGSFSTATWAHVAYVLNSSTSRTIYRDGGNSATDTTSVTPSGLNRLYIGRFNGESGTNLDGKIAEVGLWNAALTAAEVASLAKGFAPSKIRPQSLVFHAPLIRDLIDIKGGLSITNNNSAAVYPHPRIYA